MNSNKRRKAPAGPKAGSEGEAGADPAALGDALPVRDSALREALRRTPALMGRAVPVGPSADACHLELQLLLLNRDLEK
jgi:hypothetical protein